MTKAKPKRKLWIKSRTFLNECTVYEFLRKEVKLILAKNEYKNHQSFKIGGFLR